MRKDAKANVTPVRQRTQYSCMAASMTMCLRALDHDVTEDEVNDVMGARPMKGAAWEQALATAQHYGCRATLTMPATVEQLKAWTDAGIPIMIAWNPEGREWSHASVVFDVDDDLNVYVADPNIPNPKETVRVVPEDDFYGKWYEKFPNYLVRRPACAIQREVSMGGEQLPPTRTAKVAGSRNDERLKRDYGNHLRRQREDRADDREFERQIKERYIRNVAIILRGYAVLKGGSDPVLMSLPILWMKQRAKTERSLLGLLKRMGLDAKQVAEIQKVLRTPDEPIRSYEALSNRWKAPTTLAAPPKAEKTVVDSATAEKMGILDTLAGKMSDWPEGLAHVEALKKTYEAGSNPSPDDLKKLRNMLYRNRMRDEANHFRQAGGEKVAYEQWYVDAKGYANDDEGNRWYVGKPEGHYRPGSIPGSGDSGGGDSYDSGYRRRSPLIDIQQAADKAILALIYQGNAQRDIKFLWGVRNWALKGRGPTVKQQGWYDGLMKRTQQLTSKIPGKVKLDTNSNGLIFLGRGTDPSVDKFVEERFIQTGPFIDGPKPRNAPKAPAAPSGGGDKAEKLKILEALIAKRPGDGFLQSIRNQVARGKALSEPQLKAVRQNLYRNRMRGEADVFRQAAEKVARDKRPGELVYFWQLFPSSQGTVKPGTNAEVLSAQDGFTSFGPKEMAPFYTVKLDDGRVVKDVPWSYFESKSPKRRDPLEQAFKLVAKALKSYGLKRVNSRRRNGRRLEAPRGGGVSTSAVKQAVLSIPGAKASGQSIEIPIRVAQTSSAIIEATVAGQPLTPDEFTYVELYMKSSGRQGAAKDTPEQAAIWAAWDALQGVDKVRTSDSFLGVANDFLSDLTMDWDGSGDTRRADKMLRMLPGIEKRSRKWRSAYNLWREGHDINFGILVDDLQKTREQVHTILLAIKSLGGDRDILSTLARVETLFVTARLGVVNLVRQRTARKKSQPTPRGKSQDQKKRDVLKIKVDDGKPPRDPAAKALSQQTGGGKHKNKQDFARGKSRREKHKKPWRGAADRVTQRTVKAVMLPIQSPAKAPKGVVGPDWKGTAERLLKARKGVGVNDLHYRAYLRAILSGSPAAHLAKKFTGARQAMHELIDEAGKGRYAARQPDPADAIVGVLNRVPEVKTVQVIRDRTRNPHLVSDETLRVTFKQPGTLGYSVDLLPTKRGWVTTPYNMNLGMTAREVLKTFQWYLTPRYDIYWANDAILVVRGGTSKGDLERALKVKLDQAANGIPWKETGRYTGNRINLDLSDTLPGSASAYIPRDWDGEGGHMTDDGMVGESLYDFPDLVLEEAEDYLGVRRAAQGRRAGSSLDGTYNVYRSGAAYLVVDEGTSEPQLLRALQARATFVDMGIFEDELAPYTRGRVKLDVSRALPGNAMAYVPKGWTKSTPDLSTTTTQWAHRIPDVIREKGQRAGVRSSSNTNPQVEAASVRLARRFFSEVVR
jgi:hypothetical protein